MALAMGVLPSALPSIEISAHGMACTRTKPRCSATTACPLTIVVGVCGVAPSGARWMSPSIKISMPTVMA